jgi:hypothetical protein
VLSSGRIENKFILKKKGRNMKKIITLLALMSMFCGCKEKKPISTVEGDGGSVEKKTSLDSYFTAEEAEGYLTDADKRTVGECVEWIKKYEAIKDREDEESQEKAGEYIEKALEPIKKLRGESLSDKTPAGKRRSAALAWVLVDFTYNNFRGTCAIWIMMAANDGLIDAIQFIRNPPDEDWASYLLPPEEQQRRKQNKIPPYDK